MLVYGLVKWNSLSQQKWVAEDQQETFCSYVMSQDIGHKYLLLTCFKIADIISGLRTCIFTELCLAPSSWYAL